MSALEALKEAPQPSVNMQRRESNGSGKAGGRLGSSQAATGGEQAGLP